MRHISTFILVLFLFYNLAEAGFFDDNDFDGSDFATFVAEFNNCSSGCSADFDGDGDVDLLDLRFFSNNIGRTEVEPIEICGDGIDNDFDGMIDENCIVPYTRTINIDGDPEDWDGISPIILDDQGDSFCETGTDIKSLYLAQDDTYLYWRVDTYSGTFSFENPPEDRKLVLLFYETDAPTGLYPNGITVQLNGIDGVVLVRATNEDFVYLYNGQEYGTVGTIAEGRIPISEFNPFNIEFVGTYYYRGPDADPQCDEASKSGTLLVRQVLKEICGDNIDNDLDGMIDENCIVPYIRTIDVDGNPEDWEGISPIVIDEENDSDCEIGTDVKSIYLAHDDTYLYWRIDTYSGNYSFGETGNEIKLDVFICESDYHNGQSLNGILFQIDSSNYCNVSACYKNIDWVNLYNGPEYGTLGMIAEGKMMLSELNPFEVDLVTAYFARIDNPPCDWVNKEGTLLIRETLVANYSFDDQLQLGSDDSGNGHDGQPNEVEWISNGKYGGACSFNGETSYIEINSSIINPLNISVSAWINKPLGYIGWQDILSGSCGTPLLTLKDNQPGWGSQCNGPIQEEYVDFVITPNEWHHLVGTYDGISSKLYYDGNKVIDVNRNGSFDTSIPVYIGASQHLGLTEQFQGYIDDLRIYNKALSEDEVQDLYNSNN